MKYPKETWEWFGNAGHLCVGNYCRFHLATKIGPWFVSTVGEYVHPRHSGGRETTEREWLKDNPLGEDIGLNRKFETMVFKAGKSCKCGCGIPMIDGHEIGFAAANTHSEARSNHMKLCEEYANRDE